ncbi:MULTISPECIES: DUF6422 family protein [Streptomyces]|uniref:Aldehyde dehydrogenase n=1 Tax=Streptomyces griseiscabiei TaxID=2993540 RepID=A0ABU4LD43_9ACTN|nr:MULTISPECIES: DUF6422 family protein [Streptomyces]MBZ3906573.1 hypothetical protein [Streptomyces griseiscabiei]MDX2913637.1 hypothetical protein [Streptomyces griseiscabiei]
MTNLDEPTAAGVRSGTGWEAYCPEEDHAPDGTVYGTREDADRAAVAHNAEFAPPHHARARVHIPDFDERLKALSDEQSEALEQAALVVVGARHEAAAMLTRVGAARFADDWFGSRCRTCGCSEYVGDAAKCGRSGCRHSAARHAT